MFAEAFFRALGGLISRRISFACRDWFLHQFVIEGVADFLSLAAQMMVSVAWVK